MWICRIFKNRAGQLVIAGGQTASRRRRHNRKSFVDSKLALCHEAWIPDNSHLARESLLGGFRKRGGAVRTPRNPPPMIHLDTSVVFWPLGAVLLLGLTSAWATRLSQRSRCQTSCQRLFLGCLALVGGTTLVSFGLGPGCWLASGFTLALMVLTVTCDFNHSQPATA